MIEDKKVLGLVLARGGSKRVPKKNIKELNGKPLIGYTIDAAKESKYIDRIITSTDSEEIAEVARSFGSETPFMRPSEFADDTATDFPVFTHALSWLLENEDYKPDIVVQLRPTSPLRTTKHIDDAIELLFKHPEADSVRTVAEPEQTPYKMYSVSDDGFLKPLLRVEGEKESFNLPGQKLPKAYKHVGYVDVMWYETLMGKNQMTGDKIVPLILEEAYSGINTPDDWDHYEYLVSRQQ